MAYENPTAFSPISTIDLCSGRHIETATEKKLISNINYCFRYVQPPLVQCLFSSTIVDTDEQPYNKGGLVVNNFHATDTNLYTSWRTKFNEEISTIRISVHGYSTVAVTGGTATLLFKLGSTGSTIATFTIDCSQELPILGGIPLADTATVTSSAFTASAVDQIELHARLSTNMEDAGPGGDYSALFVLQSVTITPEPATVGATVTTDGFYGQDNDEVAADSPLSVSLRRRQISNLDLIRKKRTEVVCSFADDFFVAEDGALNTESTSYVTVAQIPISAGADMEFLDWSLLAYQESAGSGYVKLSTLYMEEILGTSVELTLANSWSTGASHPGTWQNSSGGTRLKVYPNSDDRILVQMKSTGVSGQAAIIMGLNIWFSEIV